MMLLSVSAEKINIAIVVQIVHLKGKESVVLMEHVVATLDESDQFILK